jgi:hypothetical protein
LVFARTGAHGAAECIRVVAGASTLSKDLLRRYRLAPHVRAAAGLETEESDISVV